MLVLQLAAPGLMSSPALAALLGLDVALTLASLIVSAAIVPLTAGLFTHFFLGKALISPLGFALKLFAIIAGSALAAAVIRRLAGRAFIEAQRLRIDGLSVLAMAPVRDRRHGRRHRAFHLPIRFWSPALPRSPSRWRSARSPSRRSCSARPAAPARWRSG